MDHERGICSAWSEILEVKTNRPPHTLQDVLLKIGSNDIQVVVVVIVVVVVVVFVVDDDDDDDDENDDDDEDQYQISL